MMGGTPLYGKLLNIGFGNMVLSQRIVAVVGPDSSPIKRLIQDAKERRRLIDGTSGRRTRAVIITDSDYIILSAVLPDTVAHRLHGKDHEVVNRDSEVEMEGHSEQP